MAYASIALPVVKTANVFAVVETANVFEVVETANVFAVASFTVVVSEVGTHHVNHHVSLGIPQQHVKQAWRL